MMEERFFTVTDLMGRWAFSRRTIRNMVAEGRIRAIDMNSKGRYRIWRFRAEDVEAFERENLKGGHA